MKEYLKAPQKHSQWVTGLMGTQTDSFVSHDKHLLIIILISVYRSLIDLSLTEKIIRLNIGQELPAENMKLKYAIIMVSSRDILLHYLRLTQSNNNVVIKLYQIYLNKINLYCVLISKVKLLWQNYLGKNVQINLKWNLVRLILVQSFHFINLAKNLKYFVKITQAR
jgi:hypothetical protein